MKKITFIAIILIMLLLFSVNVCAAEERTQIEYKTGAQIEFYLDSDSSCKLTDCIAGDYISCAVADTSVAEVKNGKLVAKNEGFTYISINYGSYVVNHNIIVHSGYKSVESVTINNKTVNSTSSSNVTLYVGQKYALSINGDANIDLSNVKIRVISSFGEVEASEFIQIDKDGKLVVVGAGSCDLIVKLSSNKADEGIKISVKTDIENEELKSSALNYFENNNYQMIRENYPDYEGTFITATELNLIDELTFSSINGVSGENVAKIFHNLKGIVFDISSSNKTSWGNFTIENDGLEYTFIGATNKTYSLRLTSKERDNLKLNFENFKFQSSETPLNLEKVSNATLLFNGICSIAANTPSSRTDGSTAILASNLMIELAKGSNVTVRGGNGGYTRQGGAGIEADKLDIFANGYSENTKLYVYGGNGGNGNDYGESGASGNAGISVQSLNIEGLFSCYVYGGNGGNGIAGKDGDEGTSGKKGNNESQGKDPIYGYNGRPGGKGYQGQSGGSGANGGSAIVVATKNFSIGQGVQVLLKSGDGGDGGDAGDGGKGGQGGAGGDDDNYSILWIGDMSGGEGGPGGEGGDPGNKGVGGSSPCPVMVSNQNQTLSSINVSELYGKDGSDGSEGSKGSPGLPGDHGDPGAGG